jgi:hypothetical protein
MFRNELRVGSGGGNSRKGGRGERGGFWKADGIGDVTVWCQNERGIGSNKRQRRHAKRRRGIRRKTRCVYRRTQKKWSVHFNCEEQELQNAYYTISSSLSVMELGHLLTRSGLTYREVSSKAYHDSFCQLGSSISLPWVIYFEAFYLHVVSSFSSISVCFGV